MAYDKPKILRCIISCWFYRQNRKADRHAPILGQGALRRFSLVGPGCAVYCSRYGDRRSLFELPF
jgi:hypothetical protein